MYPCPAHDVVWKGELIEAPEDQIMTGGWRVGRCMIEHSEDVLLALPGESKLLLMIFTTGAGKALPRLVAVPWVPWLN